MHSHIKLIKSYYFTCALTPLEGFIAPVVVLYYTDYLNLSFSDYSIFISLILFINFFFELPLGMLSDRIGRKRALLLGNFIYTTALGSTLFVQESWQLMAVACVLSFGQCLASGNLDSIGYEAFSREGEPEGFGIFLARNASIALSLTAVAALAGGFLADIALELPMIVDVALLFSRLGVGVVIFLVLWPGDTRMPKVGASPLQTEKRSLLRLFNLRALSAVILRADFIVAALCGAVCFAVLRTSLNFYQPILIEMDWSASQIGILFSVSIFVSGLLSRLFLGKTHISVGPTDNAALLGVSLLLSAIGFAFGNQTIAFFLLGFLIHQVTRITIPSFAINAEQASMPYGYAYRTTAASLSMVLKSMVAATAIAASGSLSEKIGLGATLVWVNIVGAFLMGIVFVFFTKTWRRAEDHS